MMKFFLVIFLFTSCLPVEGQVYINETSTWKERIGTHGNFPDPYYYVEDYVIKFDGDTLIDNRLYYKTLKTGTLTITGGSQDTLVGIYPIHRYLDPFREENQAFYRYDLQEKKDSILHDFNLTIGDTAIAECNHANITWIDTLYLGNIPRKRFHLDAMFGETNALIEGVGAAFGLFFTPCNVYPPFTTFFQLQCFSQDGVYMQVDSTFDCSNVVHSNDFIRQQSFSIYPNPFDEDFEVHSPEEILKDLEVTITSLTGDVVFHTNIKSPDSIERISLHDVPSGMYIICLKGKDGITSFKIIKR